MRLDQQARCKLWMMLQLTQQIDTCNMRILKRTRDVYELNLKGSGVKSATSVVNHDCEQDHDSCSTKQKPTQ